MRLFKLLSFLFMATTYVVDDENGGGSDVGDEEIDDEDLDDKSDDNNSNKQEEDPAKVDKVAALEKRLKDQEDYIKSEQNTKAVKEAVDVLKAKHQGFDDGKVLAHLKELAKTDPKKAETLNNPVGWENVWNDIKPIDPDNDDPYLGRKIDPVDNKEEIFNSLKTDGAITLDQEIEVIGKYL